MPTLRSETRPDRTVALLDCCLDQGRGPVAPGCALPCAAHGELATRQLVRILIGRDAAISDSSA